MAKERFVGQTVFQKILEKFWQHFPPPCQPFLTPPPKIPKKLWDVLIHPLLIGNQKFSLVLTYTIYTKTFLLSKSNFSPTFLKSQEFKMPKSLGIPKSNNIKQFFLEQGKGGWGDVFFRGYPLAPPLARHCTSNFPY